MDLEENKNILWLVGGILIVTIVFGVAMVKNTPSNNNSTEDGNYRTVETEIKESEPSKGVEDAKVTLIEYADFQCPACKSYKPLVEQLQKQFPDQLEVVFRDFPLTQIHQNAMVAAQAAEAARLQGEFWTMHDKLFENQNEWKSLPDPKNQFVTYAEEIGLDTEQFEQDYDSSKVKDEVRSDLSSANDLNLQGTPSFILNGKVIRPLPQSGQAFAKLIEQEINNKKLDKNNEESKAVHKHADLAIYVNGRKVNLDADKYQSTEDDHKHEYLHFHDNNGDVIHQHKKGKTIGEFFNSIGMKFTDECLQLETGQEYCNTENRSLKFFVNGERKTSYGDYEFSDLDRILISFGPKVDSNIKWQLKQVSDRACIFSGKCPERGEPPEENCVGGLGTTCGKDDNSNETSTENK